MQATDFTDHPCVKQSIGTLRNCWQSNGRRVSDVVDENGHQYVDLVMEGGGVLGIALLGYTYALESVNIRFRHVGGTSAGAISAMLLAALDTPDNPKSEKVLRILSELDLFRFVDGGRRARSLVRAFVERAGPCTKLWRGLPTMGKIWKNLGLNPGDAFLQWLKERLRDADVASSADLQSRMMCPKLYQRNGDNSELSAQHRQGQLKLVAADVTTNTKAVLPDMAHLYWKDPSSVNPAWFVRASMSIPLFFHPMRVTQIPQDEAASENWSNEAGYEGSHPDEVFLVDGGVISNFPIDLFHSRDVPRLPTLGVKLGVERAEPVTISSPAHLLGAIFAAARQGADYGFLSRNPDYDRLVAFIHTGDHNWLDFDIGQDDKVDLFARGVEAATRFLMEFDWAAYKEIRRGLQEIR